MREDFLNHFARMLGKKNVLKGDDNFAASAFLTDQRGRYFGKAAAVLSPDSAEKVAQIVRFCGEKKIPIVPQGGNTSLCGAATPDSSGEAVVILLKNLNKIRKINALNFSMEIEAGVTLLDAQKAAQKHNRLFPLSLASEGSCQVGGNLSTNAGGVQVLNYGTMRDLTLGLEIVLPSGKILDLKKNLRKNNVGYDLKSLFLGAEGTLGIITSAIVRLFPRPQSTQTLWIALPTFDCVLPIFSSARENFGERLSAFEVMNLSALKKVATQIPKAHLPFESPWQIILNIDSFEKFSAFTVENVEKWALSLNLMDVIVAQNQKEAQNLWRLRENISEAQRKIGFSVKHDIALPIDKIPQFLTACESKLRQTFPEVDLVIFGHIGDGNLHYNLFLPDIEKEEKTANTIVYNEVLKMNGSISAEHGIGVLKKNLLKSTQSPMERHLMLQIKKLFDPQNLMNPGKIF